MKIGIASPVEIASLANHLSNLKKEEVSLGLGGTAVNILIDGFINAGHDVVVFTLDPSVKEDLVLTGPRLKVVFGHFRAKSRLKYIDFCWRECRQIKKLIERERDSVDIVNAHWSYEFAVGTIWTGVPHLITFRDHASSILKLTKHIYRFFRLLMDRWVRENGENFSFNSAYLKSLIKVEGQVIPNPISDREITSDAKSLNVTGRNAKICFIANGWDFRKNPEIALKAFNLLANRIKNVELHLIGKGFDTSDPNFAAMQAAGYNEQVIYRGYLSHQDFMKELGAFDILLHTAREESFGNNLIEAMAKGVPVIAGKNSGAVPWVLDNGKAGCLVDIEDAKEVCDAMERLLTDKNYYLELSINGLSNVRNRFSQTYVCNEYLNQFQKILSSKNIQ